MWFLNLSSVQKLWYFPEEHCILQKLSGLGKVPREGHSCGPAGWDLWHRRGAANRSICSHRPRPSSGAGLSESRNHGPRTIWVLCRSSRRCMCLEKEPRANEDEELPSSCSSPLPCTSIRPITSPSSVQRIDFFLDSVCLLQAVLDTLSPCSHALPLMGGVS